MHPNHSLIRPLHAIEEAFVVSNAAAPLVVVSVLHLRSGPATVQLQKSLVLLQTRHQLLRAGIIHTKGRLYFRELYPRPPIALEVLERRKDTDWQSVAENALNSYFPPEGPLLKCWHLCSAQVDQSELILCFHHAIIDGTSARLILHELLSLCGEIPLAPPSPPAAASFPAAFRKIRLWQKLARFAARQLAGEWRYKNSGVTSPAPASSQNATISLRLDPSLSRKLSLRIGREGLSLNGVLLAAMTQAVLQRRHAGTQQSLIRAISFVDLRPGMEPAVPSDVLGCYISMLRLDIPRQADSDTRTLARGMRRAMFEAGRRGEPFLMAIISKFLVQLVFRLQNTRLGISALSFIGALDLQRTYGAIQLDEVRAYITNNRFGPEFSAFGKILFGSIGLDFTYLTAEMDDETARYIVEDVKMHLEKLADLP